MGGGIKEPMVSAEKILSFLMKNQLAARYEQHLCSFAKVSGWHKALGVVGGGNVESQRILKVDLKLI